MARSTLAAIALFGLVLVIGGAEAVLRICQEDVDCQLDECCALHFTGQEKICKDIPDDYGDFCGGNYFCPRCSDGLECTPVINTSNSTCGHPANGTCKYLVDNKKDTPVKVFPTFTDNGERSCQTDKDCQREECCATHFTGRGKVCRDIGDDLGDSCGGEYFCHTCLDNFLCLATPKHETEQPADGKDSCSRPAHGSCQYPTAKKNLIPPSPDDLLPIMFTGYKRPCQKDLDCRNKECCVTHFSGLQKVCRDFGDDLGDSCGGEYFCSECSDGLECRPEITKDKGDKFKCNRPANGTCQYPASRLRGLILDEDD